MARAGTTTWTGWCRAATEGDAGADEWARRGQEAELDPLTCAEATLAVCQLVLRGVAEADYHQPTVCTEFDVTQLAEHLTGSVTFLGGAADAPAVPAEGTTLEARVAAPAQAMLEAWRVRGLDGRSSSARTRCPPALVLGIVSVEFLVHAWDFARATGQQLTVSDGLSQFVLDLASQLITPEGRGPGGFADPVQAGPDAGLLDRLIAFTGRAVSSVH